MLLIRIYKFADMLHFCHKHLSVMLQVEVH